MRLPARVKGKVYSSLVRPAMVYGLETGGYKETSRRDGNCRDENVKGVTRKDKIKSEYIMGIVKVERLGMKMREGRLRWYGHVIRRD